MSYTPTWTNANAQGRLDAGVHAVCLCDAQELALAIDRRRLLTYQGEQDFSSYVQSGAWVRKAPLATGTAPPFDNFRTNLASKVLSPPFGSLGGMPPSPTSMHWLWPVAGIDEDKILVSGATGVGEGEVGLFQKLNGTNHWTDPTLMAGQTAVRAEHGNEPRQAVEWMSRGRWKLPVYFSAGIFSPLPDTPWSGEGVANNGTDELRSLGFAIIRTDESPVRGLANVTVRSSSCLELTADTDCTIAAYHCLRPMDFVSDPPTWNEYAPGASGAWSSPGGLGTGDATLIGSIDLTANTPDSLSNSALASALQTMIDGAEQNFLLRRSDTGSYTVGVTGSVIIEFDLDSPPN